MSVYFVWVRSKTCGWFVHDCIPDLLMFAPQIRDARPELVLIPHAYNFSLHGPIKYNSRLSISNVTVLAANKVAGALKPLAGTAMFPVEMTEKYSSAEAAQEKIPRTSVQTASTEQPLQTSKNPSISFLPAKPISICRKSRKACLRRTAQRMERQLRGGSQGTFLSLPKFDSNEEPPPLILELCDELSYCLPLVTEDTFTDKELFENDVPTVEVGGKTDRVLLRASSSKICLPFTSQEELSSFPADSLWVDNLPSGGCPSCPSQKK